MVTTDLQLTLDDIETQFCPRCERHLHPDYWHPGKRGKRGTYCRGCSREYHLDWKRANGVRPRRQRTCAHPDCTARPSSARAKYCKAHRPKTQPTSREYRVVHQRITRARGKASEQACVSCGDPAEQWAYDHSDPHEVTGRTPNGHRCTYSLDVSHYQPMCRRCHARADGRRRRRDDDGDLVWLSMGAW